MDISWGYAGLIAAGGIIGATWRQIKEISARASDCFVQKATLDPEAAKAVYEYCCDTMSLFPLRPKIYTTLFSYRKLKSVEQIIVFEQVSAGKSLFRKGMKFVFLNGNSGDGSGGANTARQTAQAASASGVVIQICLPRICGNLDAFIREAVIYQNAKIERNHILYSSRNRFCIKKYYGRDKNVSGEPVLEGRAPANTSIYKPQNNGWDNVWYNIRYQSRFLPVSCKREDLDTAIYGQSQRPFDSLFFPEEVSNLVEEAKMWHQSEAWYEEKCIPWTSGWLIHGEPGSGKTSLLRSIAQYLDMPVLIFDIASMSNKELGEHWNDVRAYSPCMVVIEDIDGVFRDRKNIAIASGGLTFDCLLNCISGVESNHGIFLGITTNHIENIDAAIGVEIDSSTGKRTTRPGRIDRIIKLGKMDENCRRKFAQRIFNGENSDLTEDAVTQGNGMTAAQFSSYCTYECLKRRQAKNVESTALVEPKMALSNKLL